MFLWFPWEGTSEAGLTGLGSGNLDKFRGLGAVSVCLMPGPGATGAGNIGPEVEEPCENLIKVGVAGVGCRLWIGLPACDRCAPGAVICYLRTSEPWEGQSLPG